MHLPYRLSYKKYIFWIILICISSACITKEHNVIDQAGIHYLDGKKQADSYAFSLDLDEWNNAKQFFLKAIELNPDMPEAWLALGWTYFDSFYWWSEEFLNKDYLDSVLISSNKTLELDPGFASAYHLRGRYYAHSGNSEAALKDLKKAVTLHAEDVSTLLTLGWFYCQFKEDYVEGFKYYNQAIAMGGLDNWPPRYHNDLAYGYMNIADYDKALFHLHKAIRFQPGVMEPILLSSWLLEVQGKMDEKLFFLDSIQQAFPGSNAVVSEWAYTYAGIGNFEEAEKYYASVIDTLDNEQRIPLKFAHRLGYVFWNLGQKDRAMEYFDSQMRYCEESLSKGEGYQTVEYDLAAVHAFLGDTLLAIAYLEKYAEKGFTYGLQDYILRDPLFKNIKENERFLSIVKKAQNEKRELRRLINKN